MKKPILRWLLLAAIGLLVFQGCNLLPTSIEDRVAMFLEDVNNMDYGSIYLNFHPDLTGDYDAIRNETYPDWTIPFPPGSIPFSISSLNTSNPANVTGMVDSPNGGWISKPITFVMAQDGMDWMIQEMNFNTITIN